MNSVSKIEDAVSWRKITNQAAALQDWTYFLSFSKSLGILKQNFKLRYNLHTEKFTLMYSYVHFCECIQEYKPHHSQNKEQFSHVKSPLTLLCSHLLPDSLLLPSSRLLLPDFGTQWYLFCPCGFAHSKIAYKWNRAVCSLSLCSFFVSFIHTSYYMS